MQMTQKGAMLPIMPVSMSQVEFEGTKGLIRIRKSMKETTQLPKEKGQNDRYIEFHSQYGRYHRLRIPKYGRDMAYHAASCDLYVAGVRYVRICRCLYILVLRV